jgi:hypothetical protein
MKVLLMLSLVLLVGCDTVSKTAVSLVAALPSLPAAGEHEELAPNWVQATGYAPISLQPGQTQQQKVVMAMRASKLRAYQELVAVVHGQYIFGTTTVDEMVVKNDSFKASVAGFVRGARVVKTYPVQDDTYATVLEVDMSQLQRAWVSN